MTVHMTLLRLPNGLLFSVCEITTGFSQEWVHPRRHRHFFPHCTEYTPNCDLNAEVCTEPWLLWNVPPQTQLVPFATNEKKHKTKKVFFFQDEANSASTFTKVNTYILMKSSYLFFYGFQYTFTQDDTSKNDLVEWKLYCKFVCCLWY